QDRLDQRQGHSGQSVEATSESVADQKSDGERLDALRRKKKSDSSFLVFVASGRTPQRNWAQAIRDLLQIRICSQSLGSRCLSLRARRGVTTQRENDVRRICRLDSIQQRYLRSLITAPLPIGLVRRSEWKCA